ncbi:MAG: trypsin-like serine protease [Rhodocyclaceae bacterium]
MATQHMRRTLLGCALGLSLGLGAPASHAIVGGSGADTSSFWSGVVEVGGASGVLLSSGYILTAGHVAYGAITDPSSLSITFVINGVQTSVAAEAIYVDGFNWSTDSSGRYNNDIALIKLATAAPTGATSYDLYSGAAATGSTVTMVGFGNTGTGASGETNGTYGTRYIGSNRIDKLYADSNSSGTAGYTGLTEIVEFDFDGGGKNAYPTSSATSAEAQYGSGDSGSPMFIQSGGQWLLYGIASYHGQTCAVAISGVCQTPYSLSASSFGSIGGATYAPAYTEWINTTIAAVPEPHGWMLLLGGLGVLALRKRRLQANR